MPGARRVLGGEGLIQMTKASSAVLINMHSPLPEIDTLRCVVCTDPLHGRQTQFCSRDCRLKFYRMALRKERDRTCTCGVCGREFRLGRRRIN